mgnify:CR=1 FL=1
MDVWINDELVGKVETTISSQEFCEKFCGFLPQSLDEPEAKVDLNLWLASGNGRPRRAGSMLISYRTIEANVDPLIRLGAAHDQPK